MKLINLAGLAVVFVILYNLLFFHVSLGIGNGVLYLLLNTFFFIVRNKETKNLDLAITSSTVAVFFAFLFSYIGNGFVQFIDLVLAIIVSSVALFFYKYEPRFLLTLPNFLTLPLSSASQTVLNLFSLLSKKEELADSTKNDLTPALFKGGVIALILVGVLLMLLTKGDLVFGQIVNNFLSTIQERLIVSTIVFISLMNFGLSKIKSHFSWLDNEVNVGVGKVHELTIILGSIIALFTLFIGVQFRYLFFPVGEIDLAQIGISSATYSEYVRAGFSELLFAGVIVGGVLMYALRYSNKLLARQKALIQFLAVVLTLENYLILVSATKRLFLYVDAHGLTRAREFGFAFLIWLTVILGIILIGVLHKISRGMQAKLVIGITLAVLLCINIVNLDELIATQYPPTVNQEIDYAYLTGLSTDAHESWVPAVSEAQSLFTDLSNKQNINPEDYRKFTYARRSMRDLDNNHIRRLQYKYGSGARIWQAFNLSEYFAYQYIRDNKEIFDRVSKLLEQANQIDQKVSMEVKNTTQLDRSTNTPLTN